MKTRTERDTFGPIKVLADKLWGAQARQLAGHDPSSPIRGADDDSARRQRRARL